jgi:transposase
MNAERGEQPCRIMSDYVGLDVSLKETSVCVVVGDGRVIWRGTCGSTPAAMSATLSKRAPEAVRVVLESGTLSTWHWHGLKELGVPVVCVDARQAKAALSGRVNKSDALDAEGLAQLARTGWYAEVRVKSLDSHRIRSVLVVRAKLVDMKRTLSNTTRSLLKTFGLFTCGARGKSFAERVRAAAAHEPLAAKGIEALLSSWEAIAEQVRGLDRLLSGLARRDPVCRDILMTAPGVGSITALAFKTVIDAPQRFRRGEEVAGYLGLAPRRRQSGDVDRMGRISRCGDSLLRSYLFEAATVALSRVKRATGLAPGRRRWPKGSASARRGWRWRANWRSSCSPCGAASRRSAGGLLRSARRRRPCPRRHDAAMIDDEDEMQGSDR